MKLKKHIHFEGSLCLYSCHGRKPVMVTCNVPLSAKKRSQPGEMVTIQDVRGVVLTVPRRTLKPINSITVGGSKI